MTPKTIAFDFDDTFTADPEMMAQWIRLAKSRGHRVICVTCRQNVERHIDFINAAFDEHDYQVPIFLTSGQAKYDYMRRKWQDEYVDYKVDIWVDDAPHAVVHGI